MKNNILHDFNVRVCLKKIHSLLSANELNLLSIYILKHVIFTGQFLANNADFFFLQFKSLILKCCLH